MNTRFFPVGRINRLKRDRAIWRLRSRLLYHNSRPRAAGRCLARDLVPHPRGDLTEGLGVGGIGR